MHTRMGVERATGKIFAFAADHVLHAGGLANFAPQVAVVGAVRALGIYYVPKADVTTVALHTRGVTAGSMRGYGTLQTMTALEVLIDEAARALPLDPGVYLFEDARANIVYVGKAKSLRARVRNYYSADSLADAKTGEAKDLTPKLEVNTPPAPFGGSNEYAFSPDGVLAAIRTAVDVREFDPKTQRLERPTDDKKEQELARRISPITHVSAESAPTLLVHGDADVRVPLEQSEAMVARLKEVGVAAELVVRKGRKHDFSDGAKDLVAIVDWFDQHLKKK